ncbi:YcaO-like family protein [Brochothrix thermosphacta]|uniref:YcaO-like family protein n=1 Tax=Brochothrix thermosphacta TaxID=2756 RepID=UPI00241E0B4E|nr:YcaO-like family protein [Brochothrix thermosphacta]
MRGFLRNKVNFIVNEDLFLSHHYNIYIEKYSKQSIKAYEVDLNSKRQHLLSTLGEFFEREILINENSPRTNFLTCTNLIDGSTTEFSLGSIIFKNRFVDSSGMASQRQSKPLIWTAYKEFFERQSFIVNYLFQKKAEKLVIDNIEEAKNLHKYLMNFLDNISYYNISLDKCLFVILAVGYGKVYKAVGLGTSRSGEKALIKAQKEMLQYFAVSFSKFRLEKKPEFYTRKSNENKDIYHDNFDKLSILEFKESYDYFRDSKDVYLEELTKVEKKDYRLVIKHLNESLNMSPYITVLENNHAENVKVVKVFDPNWFPHMAPKHYSVDTINYVERVLGLKRVNFSELLPFP